MEGKTSSGIGFTGLLTIVFIVLKLTGVINWSWIWVLSPAWIHVLLIILVVIILKIAEYTMEKYRR